MSDLLDIVLEHGVSTVQLLGRCACVSKRYRNVVHSATSVWRQIVSRQMRNTDRRKTRITKAQAVKIFCLPKVRAARLLHTVQTIGGGREAHLVDLEVAMAAAIDYHKDMAGMARARLRRYNLSQGNLRSRRTKSTKIN